MSTKELGLAASTIWVVIAAILVIFMQAGFAFLEAGLTRMKNVGHIAAKNVLILGDRRRSSTTSSASASRSATAATASSAAPGFLPTVDELLAIGKAPFSWFGVDPGAARRYLFQIGVRGGLARDRLGRDGRADAPLGVHRLRRRLHADLLGRLPLDLEPGRLAVLEGHAGLRRLDGRPLPGRARRARRRAAARPADRQVRRTASRRRSPATTWRTRRSACSSSGSAGSGSTPARR